MPRNNPLGPGPLEELNLARLDVHAPGRGVVDVEVGLGVLVVDDPLGGRVPVYNPLNQQNHPPPPSQKTTARQTYQSSTN